MDVQPVAGVEDLEAHIKDLIENPETKLKVKLFDDVELQLTEANTYPLIPRLVPSLTTILNTTPYNPDKICSLISRLLRPITFTQAMTLASEESLVLALQSPAPSASLLALSIIQKASRTPAEAAILSNMQTLVTALLTTWLTSPHVEIGSSATTALQTLLETDTAMPSKSRNATLNLSMNGKNVTLRPQTGQGLLWRRIFQDKPIYATIFALCSSDDNENDDSETIITLTHLQDILPTLDDRQRSLAQARLLRILPSLTALDFPAITKSHFADVEGMFGQRRPRQNQQKQMNSSSSTEQSRSLLEFALLNMVDKSDVLMHITLVDFVRDLLDTLAMVELDVAEVQLLHGLIREAAEEDEAIDEMLKGLKESAGTTEELASLLARLSIT